MNIGIKAQGSGRKAQGGSKRENNFYCLSSEILIKNSRRIFYV